MCKHDRETLQLLVEDGSPAERDTALTTLLACNECDEWFHQYSREDYEQEFAMQGGAL